MSRTEPNSHANMQYIGREALAASDTGRKDDGSESIFTPDYDAIKVRLVDAALKYDFPFTNKTYVLLVRSALHVPSIYQNL
eukprot:15338242-Ditylum_brightwellii.AAC.3